MIKRRKSVLAKRSRKNAIRESSLRSHGKTVFVESGQYCQVPLREGKASNRINNMKGLPILARKVLRRKERLKPDRSRRKSKWKGIYTVLPRNIGMKERRKMELYPGERIGSRGGVCFQDRRDSFKCKRKELGVRSMLTVQ